MTTLVTADEKGRVPIRGSRPGRKYLVTQAGSEWRVSEYVSTSCATRNRREWAGAKKKASVWSILRAMGDAGLTIERSENGKQAVPSCRF